MISTAINTVQPCFGPEKNRIVLGEDYIDLIQFNIEKEEAPLESCAVYDWR